MSAVPLSFAVNALADIHDVAPGDLERERPAFDEMREVLKKYGLQEKYGVALLHKHFNLAADEQMVEYTDFENRTLISKPVKLGEIPSEARLMETVWKLDDNLTRAGVCVVVCFYDPGINGHKGVHRPG